MHLTKNGVTIQVDDAEVVNMILQYLNRSTAPVGLREISVPCIGESWPDQGGIYAGIMRGHDGGPDYHLIVGPEHDGELKWQAAMDWAIALNMKNSIKDFTLPFCAEQSLLFAAVPELFEKTWYWSREQRAEDADYAWYQSFGNGYQHYDLKGYEWRARAVRRVAIR